MEHAFGVDDDPLSRIPVPSPVLGAGQFSQALLGHSCQAPKLAGAIGHLALGKAISTLLYDVAPTDPLTLAAVSILLTVVTVTACYVPARRALRIDPMIALKSE